MYCNDDISSYLALEVKKELAERYFGFRKLIEENKEAFCEKIKNHSITVEQEICLELLRISLLLGENELIEEFYQLAGLAIEHFHDPFLLESSNLRGKAFSALRSRGLTRMGRFNNLLFDSYARLVKNIELYREKYSALLEEEETILEEISLFHRRHDLGIILDFLRTLDAGAGTCALGDEPCHGAKQGLERKMRVDPPRALREVLPLIPPLVPLPRVKKELKRLARTAFSRHGGLPL